MTSDRLPDRYRCRAFCPTRHLGLSFLDPLQTLGIALYFDRYDMEWSSRINGPLRARVAGGFPAIVLSQAIFKFADERYMASNFSKLLAGLKVPHGLAMELTAEAGR